VTENATSPFVTVVIPTLNEAGRIEACLQSVADQDYPPDRLEVLVADGGSTDGTKVKTEAFSQHHPQVRLVDNPKRVQAAAFNLGVRQGRGDFIIRLDAHASYNNDYIRQCVEVLTETGAANAGGVCETRPGAETLVGRAVAVACTVRFGAGAARFRAGGKAGPVDTVPFGAFPRETFENVGLMDERLTRGEDNEFNARIRQHGLTVYLDPKIVWTYFTRPTAGSFLKQMFDNGFYHALTLMVNPGGCSVRHLVPFGFVIAMLTCATAGMFWSPAWYVGGAILGLYLLANVAASLQASARHGWGLMIVLPWLFPMVHVTYGVGTMLGIVRFVPAALAGRYRKGVGQAD